MPYVYLVQPVILLGTNRYKIGMSSLTNFNRLKAYGKGTKKLHIAECDDALQVERELIRTFRDKYTCIGGNEYFQADDELEMINLFINTVMEHKNGNTKAKDLAEIWMKKFAAR